MADQFTLCVLDQIYTFVLSCFLCVSPVHCLHVSDVWAWLVAHLFTDCMFQMFRYDLYFKDLCVAHLFTDCMFQMYGYDLYFKDFCMAHLFSDCMFQMFGHDQYFKDICVAHLFTDCMFQVFGCDLYIKDFCMAHLFTDCMFQMFGRDLYFKDFCVAHLFTHQQFSGNVLGLAYIASADQGSAGGICSPSTVKHGFCFVTVIMWCKKINKAPTPNVSPKHIMQTNRVKKSVQNQDDTEPLLVIWTNIQYNIFFTLSKTCTQNHTHN